MTPGQIALWLSLFIAFGYTVYGYPHKYGALTGRSRLFRTIGLFIINLLIVLVLMGTYIDFHADVNKRIAILRFTFYWTSCIILGLSLPLIAALDAMESYVSVRREKREYLEQMIQEEIERVQTLQEKKKSAAAPPSEQRDEHTEKSA